MCRGCAASLRESGIARETHGNTLSAVLRSKGKSQEGLFDGSTQRKVFNKTWPSCLIILPNLNSRPCPDVGNHQPYIEFGMTFLTAHEILSILQGSLLCDLWFPSTTFSIATRCKNAVPAFTGIYLLTFFKQQFTYL